MGALLSFNLLILWGSKVHNTFQDASDLWEHNVWDLKTVTSLCPKARARSTENIKPPQKIEMGEIWGGGRGREGKEGRTEGVRWLQRHYEKSLDLALWGYTVLTTLRKVVMGDEGSKIKCWKKMRGLNPEKTEADVSLKGFSKVLGCLESSDTFTEDVRAWLAQGTSNSEEYPRTAGYWSCRMVLLPPGSVLVLQEDQLAGCFSLGEAEAVVTTLPATRPGTTAHFSATPFPSPSSSGATYREIKFSLGSNLG